MTILLQKSNKQLSRRRKMNKATAFISILMFSVCASATTVSEVKSKMRLAREAVTTALETKKNDKATMDRIQKTGDDVTTAMKDLKAAGKEAQVTELQKIWDKFKSNRDGKLKDLLTAGNFNEAIKFGTGEQAELLAKMKSIIDKLDGGGI